MHLAAGEAPDEEAVDGAEGEFAGTPAAGGGAGEPARIGLVTISKPVWFYGLEACADRLLPPKEGRLRRIAFAQLAQIGGASCRERV